MGISSARTLRMICAIVFLMALATTSPAQTLTTLYSFTNGTDGADPNGLVQGKDGNFYGTTTGGQSAHSTVFQITLGGVLTTLYTFTGGTDGALPAGLVQASDGNFYGTTIFGGTGNFGTVFQITPAGSLTTLYSFTGGADGFYPVAGLVQGSDGNFYGTTQFGGTVGYGTVFQITPTGVLTTLYSFTGGTDGSEPDGLVQASDGNFYGTTASGGTGGPLCIFINGCGTLFQITPAGTLTTLYTFTGGTDGALPHVVVQGSDSNFYGTTTYGGGTPAQSGTVFKITPAGTVTTLYSFTGGADGGNSIAGLVQGSDGNFYGTTSYGGLFVGNCNSGCGTVFQITPTGTLTTLHSFTGGTDGGNSGSGLVQGSDGNFYGTTQTRFQMTTGYGVVFKLQLRGVSTRTAAVASNPYIGYGKAEKLSATVLARTGSPRGIVDFNDGLALLGSAHLDHLGVAHLTISNLSVGSHSITATYLGQNNFLGSTSAAITVRVH